MNFKEIAKNADAVYIMWLRHMKRFLRTKGRIFGSIIQPMLFMIAFGLSIGKIAMISGDVAKISYFQFLVAGLVGMSVIFTSIMAGISVIWDRQFGFLKEVLVAPVSRLTIVFGRALRAITTAIIQAVIVILLALAFGVKINLTNLWLIGFFIIMLSLFSVGLGLILSFFAEDFESFQFFQNILIMPLIFLSNAFIPVSKNVIGKIISLNPISYGIDGIRYGLTSYHNFGIFVDSIVILVFSLILVLLASFMLTKIEV